MAIHLGSTEVKKIMVGSESVAKVFLGDTMVWSAASDTAMRREMVEQSLPTSYTTVTGWEPFLPDYPGSEVVNNALLANGDDTGRSATVSLEFTNTGYTTRFAYWRILINGEVEYTGPQERMSANASVVVTHTLTGLTLADGDTLSAEAYGNVNGNIRVIPSANNWAAIYKP